LNRDETENELGQLLRRLRQQNRWSLKEVADRIYQLNEQEDLGVDASAVSRWERGRRPRSNYLRLLSILYGQDLTRF
jgi:transcriptional regulator with XRE-family HTH domain